MKIDKACFAKLLDFVRQFPHYFVGSNADLPIVGGSTVSYTHLNILQQASPRMFLALGVAGLILLTGTDLSVGRMLSLIHI